MLFSTTSTWKYIINYNDITNLIYPNGSGLILTTGRHDIPSDQTTKYEQIVDIGNILHLTN